jgi:hypothetical protein
LQTQIDEEPPAYSSPGGAFETPAPIAKKIVDDSSPIPAPNFEKSPKPETPETSKEGESSPFENAPSAATGATAPAEPKSDFTDNVKEQLSDALAQIQRLKAQLTEQGEGLRQRKVGEGSSISKAGNTLQQQIAQPAAELGVPVQIVAALCLLSFLLAYFFF